MCQDNCCPISFESLLSDPLVRLMMDADGVSVAEFVLLMHAARDAVAARGRHFAMRVVATPLAMSAQA